jgi:hypothetical protein
VASCSSPRPSWSRPVRPCTRCSSERTGCGRGAPPTRTACSCEELLSTLIREPWRRLRFPYVSIHFTFGSYHDKIRVCQRGRPAVPCLTGVARRSRCCMHARSADPRGVDGVRGRGEGFRLGRALRGGEALRRGGHAGPAGACCHASSWAGRFCQLGGALMYVSWAWALAGGAEAEGTAPRGGHRRGLRGGVVARGARERSHYLRGPF